MTEIDIGPAEHYATRKVLAIDDIEVGIFKLDGQFYAYENVCPHYGGPACQGKILPLTLEATDDDMTSIGRVFSKEQTNIVCPWHGLEFDIRTGRHSTRKEFRLRRIDIRHEDGNLFLTLPSRS